MKMVELHSVGNELNDLLDEKLEEKKENNDESLNIINRETSSEINSQVYTVRIEFLSFLFIND